jgi:hypothetical protein
MLVGAKEPMEKNLGKGRVRLINCQEWSKEFSKWNSTGRRWHDDLQ